MNASPQLGVTVAVCTYDRPRLLRETLRSLVRQDYPAPKFEIVVIDNNSPGDATRRVVESFHTAPVPPRYLHEPRQGLSHARNRAVAESAREVIVFADDDVIVEPDWLRELLAPLEQDPRGRICVLGGEVVPVYPEGVSRWSINIYDPLRLRPTSGPLRKGQIPMGANLAFRRQALLEVGLFDEDVGRQGDNLLAGDENRPVKRLHDRGAEVWFVPAARVFHQMPRERTTLRYGLRHAHGSARSRVLNQVESLRDAGRSPLSYLLTRLLANLAKGTLFALQALLLSLLLQPAAAGAALIRSWRACGYLRQISLVLARPRQRPVAPVAGGILALRRARWLLRRLRVPAR